MASPTAPTQNVFSRPASGDTDNNLLRKINGILATGAGLGGVDQFSDAAAHTGDWGIVHAVTDVVIGAIVYAPATQAGSLAGVTLKAGDRIYGSIKSFSAASGTYELYRTVK
jgi:hypothetical protein